MTPTAAVKSGFVNAFTFSGRARRPEYWWFLVFVFVSAAAVGAVESVITGASGWGLRAFQVLVFVPFLSVGWRRLQDAGLAGWCMLVPVAVILATWLVIGSVPARALPEGALITRPPMQELAAGIGQALTAVAAFVQIVAGISLLWMMSLRSQKGINAHGPEPRVR